MFDTVGKKSKREKYQEIRYDRTIKLNLYLERLNLKLLQHLEIRTHSYMGTLI